MQHVSQPVRTSPANNAKMTAARGLAELVHALPRELFDEILELTFTPNASEVKISGSYLPPPQLQVSRSTREAFAASYYRYNCFLFEHLWGHDFESSSLNRERLSREQSSDAIPPRVEGAVRCGRWLNSLEEKHRNTITLIRWDLEPRSTDTVQEAFEEFIWAASLALSSYRNHFLNYSWRMRTFGRLHGSAIKPNHGGGHEETWIKFLKSNAQHWQALGGILQKGPNGGDQFYEQMADGQLHLVMSD